jgi:hypothetical protein
MPAKRVLISIDERLLARIDARRELDGLSRSAYLAQLADADLGSRIGPGADPGVRAALSAIEALLHEGEGR